MCGSWSESPLRRSVFAPARLIFEALYIIMCSRWSKSDVGGPVTEPFLSNFEWLYQCRLCCQGFFARPCARLYSLKRKDSVDQTWPATFFITTTKVFAHDNKGFTSRQKRFVIDIWCIVVASEVCTAAAQVAAGGVAAFGHRLSSKAVRRA